MQDNLRALAVYLLITVGASAVGLVGNVLVAGEGEKAVVSGPALVYQFGLDVFLVVAYSLAQCIAFARMGKEMDRPLWKVADDREAIRRFFKLWVALNAALLALLRLSEWTHVILDNEELASVFFTLFTFAGVVHLPAGACIMFFGRFEWHKLGECLSPLANEWPKTLVVLFLSGFLLFLSFYLIAATGSQKWLRPLIDIILGYFDCLIFAAVWLICITDRDSPRESDIDYF